MSFCEGLHCPGCADGTSLIPAAALAVGVWFTATHAHTITRVVDDLLITAAVTVGILLTLTAAGLIRQHRKDPLTRVLWVRKTTAIPAPANVRQMPNVPASALTAAQLAGLAALGEAIYDVRVHGVALTEGNGR